MTIEPCGMCAGTGEFDFPVLCDGCYEMTKLGCPVCKPWAEGFPGMSVKQHWVAMPSAPGEPAIWLGWPKP